MFWNCEVVGTAATAMTTRRLNTFEAEAKVGAEAWPRGGDFYKPHGPVWRGLALFWQGQWEAAIESTEEAIRVNTAELARLFCFGADLWCKAHARPDDFDAVWAVCRPHFPKAGERALMATWVPLIMGPGALATVGRRDEAHALYPLVVDCLARELLSPFMPGILTSTMAGVSAAAGQDWTAAESHSETALRQAQEMPDVVAQPEARRWYAWMLIDRDASGDREKARALLGEAIQMYRTIGMPKHVDMAEETLKTL